MTVERRKVSIPYNHDPADHATILMAVLPPRQRPTQADWRAAYRDTVDGRKVIWVKMTVSDGWSVWVRDREGVRESGSVPL
jgi:hypothetical protein